MEAMASILRHLQRTCSTVTQSHLVLLSIFKEVVSYKLDRWMLA